MNTEKLKEVIENSDMVRLQKIVAKAFISRAEQYENKKEEDRLLIEQVANENKLSEVIVSTDEVKIYTISSSDEWDVKYPFRIIYLNKKGVWERIYTVSPNLDLAYLSYLEYKHLGLNSQFVQFAMKMLEIPNEE